MSLSTKFAKRIKEPEEAEHVQITTHREQASVVRVERGAAVEELFHIQHFILKEMNSWRRSMRE